VQALKQNTGGAPVLRNRGVSLLSENRNNKHTGFAAISAGACIYWRFVTGQ
jgi:hypothetical protein